MLKIAGYDNLYFKPVKPKLSDIEMISLIVLVKFKLIDLERQLFREIEAIGIGTKIERSVYNRRKRKLFPYIEEMRMEMVKKFNGFEDYFVVDSMLWKSARWYVPQEAKYARKMAMPF